MEKEELIKKFAVAKEFIGAIERHVELAQQCEQSYMYVKNNKKKKATIVMVASVLLAIYAVVGVVSRAISPDEFLMALIACAAAFFIANLFSKKFAKEMQGYANQYAQYDEFVQAKMNAMGDCVSFLPGIYQNSHAISFLEEAIQTGAAPNLDSAIQQYHAYAGRIESQQAIAQQAAALQAELSSIKDLMSYKGMY